MTHLDRFSPDQQAAVALLRMTIKHFSTKPFDEIDVPDPHALARGLGPAIDMVLADPLLMHEFARQCYTSFDLVSFADDDKTKESLDIYRNEQRLAQWAVVAAEWFIGLTLHLAGRTASTTSTAH
ncbi:hypothetical protein [Paraburkholderia saeva]|uniref:hypothetical protein n=1 Tax=Paraburkholderia saeva TaxID=2777537 RepID=UPI001DC08A92|nr:hypothetical protein [Paraburkholderia saeva]CAG4926171.1 hypothetical protein R70241_05445 [Paraburkholderia saeva]